MKQKEVWSDLHYSVKHDGRGSIKKVINVDAVITSVNNILKTSLGERVMLPSFGSRLSHMVFEPTSKRSIEQTAKDIDKVIGRWDNRVIVNSVDFYVNPDKNEARIELNFNIRSADKSAFTHSVIMPSGV